MNFFSNTTPKLNLSLIWLNFVKKKKSHMIDFFSLTPRIEACVQKKKKKRLRESNFLFNKWLTDLNLFFWTSFQYDSKSWSLFFILTQRIETLCFLKMSQRIEPLFHMSYFFTRLKELNSSNVTQRFFQIDSKSWTHFFPWPKEMTLFLQNDAQNWILFLWRWLLFFELDSKNWTELFSNWLKEWNFVLKKRFKQLNFSHKYNSKIRLKELNLFETWLTELIFETKKTN